MRSDSEYASIFDAHRLMLADPTLLGALEEMIRDESRQRGVGARRWSPGSCCSNSTSSPTSTCASAASICWTSRSELQRALQGRSSPTLQARPGDGSRVLTADDIPPSQAIQLANGAVAGFASETGGSTSHTTIIAKSLGIPAVVGVSGLVAAVVERRRG